MVNKVLDVLVFWIKFFYLVEDCVFILELIWGEENDNLIIKMNKRGVKFKKVNKFFIINVDNNCG